MKKDTGVYKLTNGNWAYRYKLTVNGKIINRRRTKNEYGEPFKNKNDAIKARKKSITDDKRSIYSGVDKDNKTIQDVYDEYKEFGRFDKAYTTIRKQDSLWDNHIKDKFGKIPISNMSPSIINDYLQKLYYSDGYSYQYVESFLKMFYLIFGQARSRKYMSLEQYNFLCTDKETKIKMPKQKIEDELKIITYTKKELEILDEYFSDTGLNTAYLLGKHCGLRIGECFGLKWTNVNIDEGWIFIDRQMQYKNGLIVLSQPKTKRAKRKIYINDVLCDHMTNKLLNIQINEPIVLQNRKILIDIDGKNIWSTDMVNCTYDGRLQTVNSMKYHSREIKKRFGIDFKYHYLRHTYGTMMADRNIPPHLLCDQMGHANIQTTNKYYIGVSETGIEIIKDIINKF